MQIHRSAPVLRQEVLRLKTEMRDALQGATESGQMQVVLGELLGLMS